MATDRTDNLQDKTSERRDDMPDQLHIHLLRSVLSVPAINERALAKLASLDFDAVIFDLEDSVAPEMKAQARFRLIEFLRHNRFAGRKTVIRVNESRSDWFADDMAAVIAAEPDAVLVPKVNDPRDLQVVADCLSDNDAPQRMQIWAMMETPRGLLNAAAIAESARSTRLACMVVGINDMRKETRVESGADRVNVVAWLMQIVLAARAYDLDVLDSVSNDFADLEAFGQECEQGRALGFDGKMLIHPAQIGPANRIFSPSAEALTQAEKIVAAFDRPEAAGLGVVNLNGRMVERLHLDEALRLIDIKKQIDSRGNAE